MNVHAGRSVRDIAEPWKVRRDQPPPVCEGGHEIAELERGGRITVRQ